MLVLWLIRYFMNTVTSKVWAGKHQVFIQYWLSLILRVTVDCKRTRTLNYQLKLAQIVSATSFRHRKSQIMYFWWMNDECDTHRSPAQNILGDVRSFRSVPLDGVGIWLICTLCDDDLNRPSWPWKNKRIATFYTLGIVFFCLCCGAIKKQESCVAQILFLYIGNNSYRLSICNASLLLRKLRN